MISNILNNCKVFQWCVFYNVSSDLRAAEKFWYKTDNCMVFPQYEFVDVASDFADLEMIFGNNCRQMFYC
jgi:hypothetical protein